MIKETLELLSPDLVGRNDSTLEDFLDAFVLPLSKELWVYDEYCSLEVSFFVVTDLFDRFITTYCEFMLGIADDWRIAEKIFEAVPLNAEEICGNLLCF